MDRDDIQRLIDADNAFYRANHASFSDSRRRPWPGWKRVAAILARERAHARVLDVACGNMRFERFMAEELCEAGCEFVGVDSCRQLAEVAPNTTFVEQDVLGLLLDGGSIDDGGRLFDACVSFGFMHHIPTFDLRAAFVNMVLGALRCDGVLALSFWRFMDDGRIAAKARCTTGRGSVALDVDLEDDDYLLGWNGKPGAYRYCHHFSDAELSDIVRAVSGKARCIDRFDADGQSGALNAYLVFRRT